MTKTWQQKYEDRPNIEIKTLDKPYAGHEPGDIMLISTPAEIESEVRKLNRGETLSITELRDRLARKHRADFTCPLTTGIFLRIAAERSLEADEKPMPFWRVIDSRDPLANKLSCGPDYIAKQRHSEGLSI